MNFRDWWSPVLSLPGLIIGVAVIISVYMLTGSAASAMLSAVIVIAVIVVSFVTYVRSTGPLPEIPRPTAG